MAILNGPANVTAVTLGIWNLNTGEEDRELAAPGASANAKGQPLWWNGGQWIVAAYESQLSGGGLGLWDADSGRFLGTFAGTMGAAGECLPQGDPVVMDDKMLQPCSVRGSQEERAMEWTVEGVRGQIGAGRQRAEKEQQPAR